LPNRFFSFRLDWRNFCVEKNKKEETQTLLLHLITHQNLMFLSIYQKLPQENNQDKNCVLLLVPLWHLTVVTLVLHTLQLLLLTFSSTTKASQKLANYFSNKFGTEN